MVVRATSNLVAVSSAASEAEFALREVIFLRQVSSFEANVRSKVV